MTTFHLAVGSTADLDLQVQGVSIDECLRQPNSSLLQDSIKTSSSSLSFKIKDHNTEVQTVFNLKPDSNQGDTAYINIKAGCHASGWHASTVVTIFKDGNSIATSKIDSGLNIGMGDAWGTGSLSFKLR
jgi:hypothetical protein